MSIYFRTLVCYPTKIEKMSRQVGGDDCSDRSGEEEGEDWRKSKTPAGTIFITVS